jgi:hypothetical protein
MATNHNPTSGLSEPSRVRAERSNKRSLRASVWKLMLFPRHLVLFLGAGVWNLVLRARLSLGKLVSFAFARALMIFVVGLAVGVALSYGGEVRKTIASWSPHLGWLAPPAAPASSERLKTISLALAAARQNLDKAASEMNRLDPQVADVPRRRSAR